MTEALYTERQESEVNPIIIPSDKTVSPWNVENQNGVCVAGLLVQKLCDIPTKSDMVMTRVTVDLFRPIPRIPLYCRQEILHDGRQLQMARTVLELEGKEFASATAQRIRKTDGADEFPPPHLPFPKPDSLPPNPAKPEEFGIRRHVEQRFVIGRMRNKERAVSWIKMNVDIIENQDTHPLARLIGFCDFGSGMSAPYRWSKWNFPNTDLSMHLVREPIGEWMLVDAETECGQDGVAIVHMTLADEFGIVGRGHQTLIVSKKPETD